MSVLRSSTGDPQGQSASRDRERADLKDAAAEFLHLQHEHRMKIEAYKERVLLWKTKRIALARLRRMAIEETVQHVSSMQERLVKDPERVTPVKQLVVALQRSDPEHISEAWQEGDAQLDKEPSLGVPRNLFSDAVFPTELEVAPIRSGLVLGVMPCVSGEKLFDQGSRPTAGALISRSSSQEASREKELEGSLDHTGILPYDHARVKMERERDEVQRNLVQNGGCAEADTDANGTNVSDPFKLHQNEEDEESINREELIRSFRR
jgi:hypothetical protein